MFDILIQNGMLIDGTGNPGHHADLGIRQGVIVAVGNLKGSSARYKVNAEGRVVCPGFIDCHTHSDATVEYNLRFDSTLRQGVTTEVVGNCGMSTAPFPQTGGSRGFGSFGNDPVPHGRTLAEHMRVLEKKGMSANLAWLVGHNTLRRIAGAASNEVTQEQQYAMECALHAALQDGAIGMSSGLEYEPGRSANPQEIVRLAAILKEYDAIYTSHIRNRDSHVLEALDEFLSVIRETGVRGEISHMNIRHNTHAPEDAFNLCIQKIESARREGLDILTEMTPLNYGIGQMSGILPPWFTSQPKDSYREMLLDPEIRVRLRGDCDRLWRFISGGEWDRVRMQGNDAYPKINGMTFPEIAHLWSKDPFDCYFDILAANAPDIEKIVTVGYLFTDAHLNEAIAHPFYILAADGMGTSTEGEVSRHTLFPLHYIGMAYFLTHHVRIMHTLRLEEAVRKMTSMPAMHFKLGKRGLLVEGYEADICVFDFDALETPFDLSKPVQYTKGMEYVFVGGVPVIDKEQHTGATPGKNLRRHKL
jgi:N-acyl-D-amino-acid deacylase